MPLVPHHLEDIKVIVERRDFQGLRQIWPPSGSPIKHKFDLVLVPGLAGGCISTWMNDDGSCWLDWLVSEIPDVRIFAFGYNAREVYLLERYKQGHSNGRTFTYTEELCTALSEVSGRMEHPSPLTFIGHGVGGIIIKNALVLANARTEIYGQILKDTHHVVFLDTPHRGLDTNLWLAVYGEMATPQAQAQFGLWSEGLTDLGKFFGGISTRFAITSAYATSPMQSSSGTMTVVEESSSALFFHNESCLHLRDTTHATMCRYLSRDDPNYRKTRNRIAAEMRKNELAAPSFIPDNNHELLSKTRLETIEERVAMSDAKLDKIHTDQEALLVNATKAQAERKLAEREKLKSKMLQWLMPRNQAIDYDADLESSRTNAVGDTCRWILSTPQYEEWILTSLSKLLWLHGIPGSGKSTTTAFTCSSMLAPHPSSGIIYFFFPPESSISTAFALCCLTHQMLFQNDAVFDALRRTYERTRSNTVLSCQTAIMVFKSALQMFGDTTIFLDALDNCEDRETLLKLLSNVLDEFPRGVRIFCSSRDEHDIHRSFSKRLSTIDLKISPDTIEQDIKAFIRIEINQNLDLMEKLGKCPGASAKIIRKLSESAQGMFLLPKLFIKELSVKTRVEEMYQFLEDLPENLNAFYLRIIMRMDPKYWPLTKTVFTWTGWARRPLSLPELTQALSIDGDEWLDLRQDIKRAVGCLITLDNDIVRLVHDSAQRFLLGSEASCQSSVYDSVMPSCAQDVLTDVCMRFLFSGSFNRLQKTSAFAGRRPKELLEISPFLKYASHHWVYHWSKSSDPFRFLHRVYLFLQSKHVLDWIEAAAHFYVSERLDTIISSLRDFILKLQLQEPQSLQCQSQLREISVRLSMIANFLNSWDNTIVELPEQIHIVAPLLYNDFSENERQNVLITRHPNRSLNAKVYNMLDRVYLPVGYDRFMLSDLHIFIWQSLMPSIPWNLAYVPADPAQPSTIQLHSISISTGAPYGRYGLDPAQIGAFTVSTSLRKDMRFAGIAWARFSDDETQPLAIKSYAWSLAEDHATANLRALSWTYSGEDDPCRVEIAETNSFRMSKCALAFADDMKTMWTVGGSYNIKTGQHRPGPALFEDPNVRALTFARNCSIIAGVRNARSLEVYDIAQKFRSVASYQGECTILGVSPLGNFVLFLEKINLQTPSDSDPPKDSKNIYWAVCLFSRTGTRSVLWTDKDRDQKRQHSSSRSTSPVSEPLELIEFYNNGGLHSFSKNDAVLVLCVPAHPDWELLAYELKSEDITNSMWRIEYTSLLSGAGILSLAFCLVHERRLYLLDSYSSMQSFDIARGDVVGGSRISTVGGEDLPPVWTIIPRKPGDALNTIFFQHGDDTSKPNLLVHEWRTQKDACSTARWLPFVHGVFAETLRGLQSQTVIADISPVPKSLALELCATGRWQQIVSEAQESVESALYELKEQHESKLDLSRVNKRLKPQVITDVTFDETATLCFFHSLIYYPVSPDEVGQTCWLPSVTMDIKWLWIPKTRKVGVRDFNKIVGKEKDSLRTVYHPGTKALVHAVSVLSYDKASNQHWRETLISITYLSAQNPMLADRLDRLHHLGCRDIRPDCGILESLVFSECGMYVFGYSSSWPSSVLQIDIRMGHEQIVHTIYNPFHGHIPPAASLSLYDNQLYLTAASGVDIVAYRFDWKKMQKDRKSLQSRISKAKSDDEKVNDNSGNRYQVAQIAACPIELQRYQRLSLVWPSSQDGRLSIIAHGVTYLRKDGKFATTPLWPMVFEVPLKDIGPWIELEGHPRELYFETEKEPQPDVEDEKTVMVEREGVQCCLQ